MATPKDHSIDRKGVSNLIHMLDMIGQGIPHLTVRQAQVLAYIMLHDNPEDKGCTQAQLVRDTQVRQGNISVVLIRFEHRGLIEARPPKVVGGPATYHLTPEGWKFTKALMQPLEQDKE